MPADRLATWMLSQEARALLTRLARVRSFALFEPMVMAAAISPQAQAVIESFLSRGRRALRQDILQFLRWLESEEGRLVPPFEAQRRFTFLRMRFNDALTQFDVFADALTQRSEQDTGVWLSGLDVVAADALDLPGDYYDPPPVICYLDRGPGAAIRRARTRLPGGGDNPVAIIRVPRERMIGSGIASSLIHEVGHQGAALLGLIESLRPELQARQHANGPEQVTWRFWERWISEIVADFWAVARLGISATMGLMAVVSLPRAFVFRISLSDPHPFPWIRVKLSAALGKALYPHPQWDKFTSLWESYYPREGLDDKRQALIQLLENTMPAFVSLLVNHRPKSLRDKTLSEVMATNDRQPRRLSSLYHQWRGAPAQMRAAPPALVFAVIGQAKADGKLTPEDESRVVANLLTYWALRSSIDVTAICVDRTARRSIANGRREPEPVAVRQAVSTI